MCFRYTKTRTTALSLLVFFFLIPAQVKAETPTLKILTLGDSITQAESTRASFRYPLWKKLIDADLKFDLVGSMKKQFGPGVPPHPDYRGKKFDPDHEGHFAWRTEEFLQGRGFDNGSGTGKLEDWLKQYDVDIVLIHLGTNDAFNQQGNASTLSELQSLFSLLRADNPEVKILLAKLIPTTRSEKEIVAVASLNEALAGLPKIASTEKSPVILIDQNEGFDGEKDLYDMVHPNEIGEEKMAEKWFRGIVGVLGL